MLAEIAPSNANFSLQDTTILFHHLALQVGPRLDHDDLRAVHIMFKDDVFCFVLIGQIERHVEAISMNWRDQLHGDHADTNNSTMYAGLPHHID